MRKEIVKVVVRVGGVERGGMPKQELNTKVAVTVAVTEVGVTVRIAVAGEEKSRRCDKTWRSGGGGRRCDNERRSGSYYQYILRRY